MRRWDRLLDSYVEEYRARGVSLESVAYTEARLNRWGRWLKGRRPRIGIERIDAEMITRYMVKPALRTKSIGFKVSEEEYAQLDAAAQTSGRSLGEWCREVLLASGQEEKPTGPGSRKGRWSSHPTINRAWTSIESSTAKCRLEARWTTASTK